MKGVARDLSPVRPSLSADAGEGWGSLKIGEENRNRR